MSSARRERRRTAIRAVLTQGAGGAPAASATAQATLALWQQLSDRLAPVIGMRGVDALLRRSLHLTNRSFPWLAVVWNDGESAVLLASLETRLATGEATAAAQAGVALLATFAELLDALIGESLTERLLDPVWSAPAPEPEQRSTS